MSVALPDDVVLEQPMAAPHLVRDFVERGMQSKTYPVLALHEAEVQKVRYRRIAEEAVGARALPRAALAPLLGAYRLVLAGNLERRADMPDLVKRIDKLQRDR